MEIADEVPGETVKLQIKFGGETIRMSMLTDSTIADLKELLKSSTNVLPRGQKLIHKGKVLIDSNTLRTSEIKNGSKIMLMAAEGLHQGEGPRIKNASVLSNYRKITNADRTIKFVPILATPMADSRIKRWKITRVIGLAESNLKAIPEEVWECGSSSGSCAKVLDLSNNFIRDIPINISCLTRIEKLILNSNEISDDSVSWEGLTQLKILKYLSFDKNKIIAIPSCIGDCSSLVEVDISSNLLGELPETFGNLQKLKVLHLNHNGLESLPSTLFKNCVELSTLNIHKAGITTDMLHKIEGWEDFDKRRRLKYQKQLDFRAGGSAEFDEGADQN
ncbi:LRR repeats and ubiquitin-like domain-containing protein At2g30105 isoform X2 [Spinacia oleracea]|uniref:LRR repeats and ubiquitin-like domain-containing protein At2g30105 isoform X2 n=1 Tax=Spinacia oleracea TaxID=3562 RepID=A0ABM3QUB3_SPIOL|nr:LRR repeats and ubiquitin-like domain-containing protein At2g30105 isoform X2 [Spinacia oleracea]